LRRYGRAPIWACP